MSQTLSLRAPEARDFRRFVLSRLLAILVLETTSVAVGWQVYALTRSPLSLGLVGLAEFLPSLGLTLLAGHAADRLDRRRILLVCHALFGVVALLLGLLGLRGPPPMAAIYAVLVLLGTARAFNAPAAQALMPSLVPEAQFGSAVALNSAIFQVGIIAGPALGGLLYALVGSPEPVYLLGALLAVVDVAALATLQARAERREHSATSWSTVLAGVRYVWSNKVILGCVSLDLFAVLLGGAVALLPVFAQDVLGTGPWGLGLLRSAPAVGAGLTGLWLSRHPLQRHAGRTMLAGVAVFGLGTVAFGLSRSLVLSILCLAIVGAADMLSVFVRLTLVQISPPPQMRGRVNAVNMLFIGASNELGEFESGLTAQWLGPVRAVIAGGVGTLLVVLGWTRLFPELARVDRLPTDSSTARVEREATAIESAVPPG
ncbi:MAG TPA: MFS transporter [Myxococcaceae bacterium]|nr:MFS transporter [Myxococcaceae bacterium]